MKGDANLVAGNIKKGVTIFGVTGTYDLFSSGSTVELLNSEFNPTNVLPTTWTGVVPSGSGCWREGPWCYFHNSYNSRAGWQFNTDVLRLAGKTWTMYFDIGELVNRYHEAVSDAWAKQFYLWVQSINDNGVTSSIGESFWRRFGIWGVRNTVRCNNGHKLHFGPDNSYWYTVYAGRCWIVID